MATEVGKGFVEVVADLDKFGPSISKGMSGQKAAFEKAGSDAGDAVNSGVSKKLAGEQSAFAKFGAQAAGSLKTALSAAVAGAPVAAAIGIGVAIKSSIDAAIDLNEQLSKTNAVFGTSADTIVKWASTAATSFGQSKTQALEAASSFGNMFLQLGIGAEAATTMSMSMTELASDFASFFNTNPAQALDAIAAAFRGEFDAVQRFVPTINAAAVEQKALEMGLAATTKELTQQDKALASYELIMTGAGQAMGDFDRTSDSLANQQRILAAQVTDLAASFGQALLPAITSVASALSGMINLAQQAGDIKAKFDWLDPILDVAANALVPIDIIKKGIEGLGNASGDTKTEVDALAASTETAKGVFSGMATVGMSASESQRRLNESFGDFEGRAAGLGDQMQAYADATATAEEKTRGLLNAQLALFDSTFAVAESQRAFNEAAIEANSTTGDQTVAFEDAAQAALRVASATVTYAEDQATLKGETLSAEDSQQILISTLSALASQIGGPVATQLNGMVGQLQTVGAQHPEPTVTLNDQASQPIADVRGKVDGLDAARASVTVNADGNANSQLQGVIDKISRINGMRIGVSTSIPGLAAGTTSFGGGLAVVGEEGPELVHLPAGTMVDNAEKTRASISAVTQLSGGLGSIQPIMIINQGTFLGTEEAFGKLADRAIAQARRSGHRAA